MLWPQVDVGADGCGTVKEQVCTSQESPEVTELWSGSFTVNEDLICFKGTEVEMMSDTGKVEECLGGKQNMWKPGKDW